ncbi:DUF1027 domain-containing protein [Fructobacillus sp. CRL 2054]|uniref:YutD family protein n=1 Tax=Fructobacillus sp. CRL 2054 TaxID=2763007 RepID=UPI00237809BE|nr:YutD-like domain-containing protein [Fructobacillus sp. CRL 2054]MDD9139210.1 DUF1027 domain-containing protein [Fructobacillus sp. CRL 2054]
MDHATLKDRTIEQQLRRQSEYQVSRIGDEIEIDGLKLTLLDNFKDAFTTEGMALRYTPLLKQYDYIVGDLSAGQLRLRGFYHEERKVSADQKINTLADYLYETVNFGAPYFILQSQNSSFRPVKERDYLTEWEEEQREKRQKQQTQEKKNAKKRPTKKANHSNRNNRPKKRAEQAADQQKANKNNKRRHRFTERKRTGNKKPDSEKNEQKNQTVKVKEGGDAKPKRQQRRRNHQRGKVASSKQGQSEKRQAKPNVQSSNSLNESKKAGNSKRRSFTIKERN